MWVLAGKYLFFLKIIFVVSLSLLLSLLSYLLLLFYRVHKVPSTDTMQFSQRTSSSSNMETMERLEASSKPRTTPILKNSSSFDLFKGHGSARLIKEDERRVSWSDLHHGKELTQVREVEYAESKLHRIMRKNKSNVIITALLFVFTIITISVTLTAAKFQMRG